MFSKGINHREHTCLYESIKRELKTKPILLSVSVRIKTKNKRPIFQVVYKREHGFCTEILSQIVVWYKKHDVTKKNRLSQVLFCDIVFGNCDQKGVFVCDPNFGSQTRFPKKTNLLSFFTTGSLCFHLAFVS